MPPEVLIIGAGEIGQALAQLLRRSTPNLAVRMWDIDPQKSDSPAPLSNQVATATLIFYCAPAAALRSTLTEIRDHFQPSTNLIILAKGLEPTTGFTTHEVVAETLPNQPYALLAGPFLAEELPSGTTAVIASQTQTEFLTLQQLFSATPVHLAYTDDVPGTALVGVLKNIYAILLGCSEALQITSNNRAVLITRIVQEMEQWCVARGGNQQTAYGLAGLGDLLATGLSPHSANFQAGKYLVETGELNQKSEGVQALAHFEVFVHHELTRYPIATAIWNLCFHQEPPATVLAQLLS